jgi:hypothetical protein
MTIAQVAAHLLGYFTPEERSIPDAAAYPGRNAAVLAAINAALQETASQGRPWAITDVRGAILNAPKSVTIATTAGSTAAIITGWESWMAGCAIVIAGEPIDNQIRNDSSSAILKFPATVTGTQAATVYATAHTCATDVMDARKPIRCDGMDLIPMSSDYPSRRPVVFNDYGMTTLRMHVPSYAERVAETVNQPRFFRVTTASPSTAASFVQRIEVYPAPAVQCFLEYKCSLTPPVVTSLTSTSTLPIPFQFVQSVFLPLAVGALMDSPFFRGTAAAGSVAQSVQEARAIMQSLQPNKTKRPRIIPLG